MTIPGAAIDEPTAANTDKYIETIEVGTHTDGKPILREVVHVARATYSAAAVDATASGENTIVDPTAGSAVRLHYVCLANGGSSTVTASVRFGAGGTDRYKVTLKAGAIWARNIGAGNNYLQGAVNENLIVNLSGAVTVNVSVEYEEVTP